MKLIVTITVLVISLSRHSQAQQVLLLTEESSEPQSRHSNTQLIARNLIDKRANVAYSAVKSVTLQPGFTARAGAIFSASIRSSAPEQREAIAEQFTAKAYPNPFRQDTRIEYTLPRSGRVQGVLTNLQGQIVHQSMNDGSQERGVHYLDLSGNGLPVGIYFYQIRVGTEQKTIRLVKQEP